MSAGRNPVDRPSSAGFERDPGRGLGNRPSSSLPQHGFDRRPRQWQAAGPVASVGETVNCCSFAANVVRSLGMFSHRPTSNQRVVGSNPARGGWKHNSDGTAAADHHAVRARSAPISCLMRGSRSPSPYCPPFSIPVFERPPAVFLTQRPCDPIAPFGSSQSMEHTILQGLGGRTPSVARRHGRIRPKRNLLLAAAHHLKRISSFEGHAKSPGDTNARAARLNTD